MGETKFWTDYIEIITKQKITFEIKILKWKCEKKIKKHEKFEIIGKWNRKMKWKKKSNKKLNWTELNWSKWNKLVRNENNMKTKYLKWQEKSKTDIVSEFFFLGDITKLNNIISFLYRIKSFRCPLCSFYVFVCVSV